MDKFDRIARFSQGIFHTLAVFGCLPAGMDEEKLRRLEEQLMRAMLCLEEKVLEVARDEYFRILPGHLLQYSEDLVNGSEN